MPKGPRLYLYGDVSVAKSWQNDESGGPFSIQLGHNKGKRTHGFRFDYQDAESYYGLYLRWFPYDNERQCNNSCEFPVTFFTESTVLFPANKEVSQNAISLSYGIIIRDNTLAGIEFFQIMRTDMTIARGFNIYTGVRIHYYFVRRRLL